jgi:cytochrome c biogenesis factor
MASEVGWGVALLAATAGHAGFQLTVTLLVYPALAAVPAPLWVEWHDRHSRRIVPLVGVVYLALAVTSVGALLSRPAPATWLAVTAAGLVVALTAGVAAPLHARLGPAPAPELLARLLRADRLRTVLALVALVAAALAAAGVAVGD